ncbi:MAG: hypothetical protein HYX69_05045 [Planctomycetia bacterium]|nr:hypothetical protein [Planctomycetia bacterium]
MTSPTTNRLAELLRNGQPLLGLHHCYPAEGILETIGRGWDFVWIDGQHGQFSFESALRSVRCASGLGLETVLRVPTHDPGLLGLYADTAAAAIMVPLVDSPEMAAAVVRALRFPPAGHRSFGGRRPTDVHGRDYVWHREPIIVAQIESSAGLENADRIAAVDGIDILFFGADDMKLHLGIPLDAPAEGCAPLERARRDTAAAAQRAGKACGCACVDSRDVGVALGLGYRLIAAGADVRFLRSGSNRALEESRRVIEDFRSNDPRST